MLFGGQLLAVVSTSALELGIDIGALDAAITVGYPGTMASLWQQWGRAGRGKGESLGIFIAGNDALEQFFVNHPESSSSARWRPPPSTSPTPSSIWTIWRPRPTKARSRPDDARFFGPGLPAALERAEESGLVRRKSDTWFYAGTGFPAAKIGLRSTAGEQYTIVEERRATSSAPRGRRPPSRPCIPARSTCTWATPTWSPPSTWTAASRWCGPSGTPTTPCPGARPTPASSARACRRPTARCRSTWDEIAVTSRVVAFQKSRTGSNEVLGTEELDLPTQEFVTEAMWFTLPAELFPSEAELVRLPGAIHAVEHALIALLPLFAMCDRWDIGGLSTPVHSQTEQPTIFVYDGHAGGVGISRQGFERFPEWVARRPKLVRDCPCEGGCPSCIQSPKCGNWNEPLDKEQAVRLLGALGEASDPSSRLRFTTPPSRGH